MPEVSANAARDNLLAAIRNFLEPRVNVPKDLLIRATDVPVVEERQGIFAVDWGDELRQKMMKGLAICDKNCLGSAHTH